MPAYTVRPDHPRIYITSDNKAALITKIQTYYSTEFQEIIDWADTNYTDVLANPQDHVDADELTYYCFIYVLGSVGGFTYGHTIGEYGNAALAIVDRVVAGDSMSGRAIYDDSLAIAIAYDWLHDITDGTQKSGLVTWMGNAWDNNLAKFTDLFWNFALEALRTLVGGMAFYGDGIDDTKATEICDGFETYMLGGRQLDGANWFSSDYGGWSEGARTYLSYSGGHLIHICDAWRTATNTDYFSNGTALTNPTFFRYIPMWLSYILIPAINEVLSHDQADRGAPPLNVVNSLPGLLSTVDSDMSALAVWLINQTGISISAQHHYIFPGMFWGDKSVAAQSPSDLSLPLTRYFEGPGMLVMRSGWGDEDTFIMFYASSYQRGSHTSYTQGGFVIAKFGGQLALHAGEGGHHPYSDWGLSTNGMIFPDPAEDYTFSPQADEGGQRRNFPGGANKDNIDDFVPGVAREIGGIKRYESSTGVYDYVFADLTRAYNCTENHDSLNTIKVEKYTRHFLNIRPPSASTDDDFIVVFDRAETTGTNFEKRWLMHACFDPTINGTPSVVDPATTKYTGADEIHITNTHGTAHAAMFCKTLYPAVDIYKVGGTNYEYWDPFLEENRGDHATLPLDDDDAALYGRWRTEAIPTSANTYDYLVHVIQTADSDLTSSMTTTEYIDGDVVAGAHIEPTSGQNEWVAMFSKTEANQTDLQYDVVAATATLHHLIADLVPGDTYTIYKDGSPIGSQVASSEGVIYFTSAGSSTFSMSSSGAAPSTSSGAGDFMGFLRQSTAITKKIGPFVDSTDGNTDEGLLTIAQSDVRLSKNGGNYGPKNEVSSCTYDEIGYYDCSLDATDTDTLGTLTLSVHVSGALHVRHEFQVITQQLWDSMFSTDTLQVHVVEYDTGVIDSNAIGTTAVTEIQSGLATGADQTDMLNRIGDFAGTGLNTVKGFLQAMFRGDAGVSGANIPSEINESENGTSGTYDPATDSQEAIGTDSDAILADTDSLDTTKITSGRASNLDNLDATISTRATPAQVNTEVDTALSDVNLDHLVGTAAGIPAVPSGTYLDQMLDDGTEVYDRTTDSLQAISDSSASGISQQQVRDAMKLAPSAGAPAAGSVDDELDSILADTDSLDTTKITSGRASNLDNLDATISTRATPSQVNTEVDTALADVNLDHLVGTAAGIPAVPSGTYLDQMLDDGAEVYDRTTDSLQAISDSSATGISQQQVRDAMKLAPSAGAPSAGSVDDELDSILADTGTDGVAVADGAITSSTFGAGAIDDSAIATDVDTYQAMVWMFDDDANGADRYVVQWFKNGGLVTSGITSPTINVVKTSDGTDLIPSSAMTSFGSNGGYVYNETTNRITDGAAYMAYVSATIDGQSRTWPYPIGRDSSA